MSPVVEVCVGAANVAAPDDRTVSYLSLGKDIQGIPEEKRGEIPPGHVNRHCRVLSKFQTMFEKTIPGKER
jgi:hypothetical protein